MKKLLIACAALTGAIATPAIAGGWQCVTYARTITDVAIRGNANTWWGQAEGRYARGSMPTPGAVLAFKAIPGMRMGHVAVVKDVVSSRELVIDHANWTHRGGVERNARAVDVSAAGDWSEVRVTFGSGMGQRVNPTFGFIYPGSTEVRPTVQFASALSIGDDIRAMAQAESGR